MDATKPMDDPPPEVSPMDAAEAEEQLELLWEVLREGDRATIEALLVGDEEHPPLGCSVDVLDRVGMTPLHWLSVEGHADVIDWIIDEVGAEVDLGDTRYGQTAVHFASTKDHARVIETLLERGADPMATDKAGWTPLHACARSGSVDACAVLATAVPAGGIDARGPGGHTPLHRAAFWGQTELVSALLGAGADRGALDEKGREPVELICAGGDRLGELPALRKLLRSPPPRYGAAA